MRISPLKRVVTENYTDGTQVSRLPNTQEMMDKINEIIKVVNELDSHKSNQVHEKFIKDMTRGW